MSGQSSDTEAAPPIHVEQNLSSNLQQLTSLPSQPVSNMDSQSDLHTHCVSSLARGEQRSESETQTSAQQLQTLNSRCDVDKVSKDNAEMDRSIDNVSVKNTKVHAEYQISQTESCSQIIPQETIPLQSVLEVCDSSQAVMACEVVNPSEIVDTTHQVYSGADISAVMEDDCPGTRLESDKSDHTCVADVASRVLVGNSQVSHFVETGFEPVQPAQQTECEELVMNPGLPDSSEVSVGVNVGVDVPTAGEQMEVTAGQEGRDQVVFTEQGYQSQQIYDFSNKATPTFVTWASSEYLKTGQENFLRGCKWSPDGSQILTNSNDNLLRIFNMPEEVTENEASKDIEQISDVVVQESGTVYDYAWHPCMSHDTPDSCRIVTTCSGIPMHLWDSTTGKLVANYKAFDQYDEITAAYSVAFDLTGRQVFGGYNKCIRIFDTEYPNKKCRLIKTCGPKKSGQPHQTGIISCFSHSPTNLGVFAAGSYTRHVGFYDLRCDGPTCVIEGQKGGITHTMFSPCGNWLFTGARKDREILCWDVRNLGDVCFAALRDVKTNQRIYFDITRCGRYMTSGNNSGAITFWDLHRPPEFINGASYLRPLALYRAHKDCVNGVSFHPSSHLLASTSGQRHFPDYTVCDNSSGTDSDSDSSSHSGMEHNQWDFSLRVWKMPMFVQTREIENSDIS